MSGPAITINSLNYDRTLRRSWSARLIRNEGGLIELVGEFDFDVDHPDVGRITRGTLSHEFYWLDRWYNVFRFHEPTGEFRSFYCNINLPPTFEDETLTYVDLDIDLLVDNEGAIRVLDVEEFEENVNRFSIPDSVYRMAKQTVDRVIADIEVRRFPFDQYLSESNQRG